MRLVGLIGLTSVLTACLASPPTSPADLVLKGVNVVDVETATVRVEQDVLIRHGRIQVILDSRDDRSLQSAQTVDARGQYLIPGLWDLHVHLESYTAPDAGKLDPRAWHAPLSMSYGVLGMRDMGSRTDDILALRDAFTRLRDSGEPAPMLRLAGRSFSGNQPWGTFDHTLTPQTPAEAAEMVKSQTARGVDFIKVHDFLTADIYRTIVQTARAGGMAVIGHLRSFSGPVESAALGHADFDHLPPELLAYCGANGERDTEAFYEGWYTGGPGYYEREMARLYSRGGCVEMFKQLAAYNVSVTPTLSVRAPVHERTFATASRVLPVEQMKYCSEARTFRNAATDADAAAYQSMIGGVVRDLAHAGIDILTGTDGSAESCGVPGLILLDELDELVNAGLTRAQVLRAATLGAAHKAGVADAGDVSEGAVADLVLLGANPLDGFETLEEPTGIVSAGQYIGRGELLAMRDRAAAYARSLPPTAAVASAVAPSQE
jgi:imidazolonepropionase-like amidohydrolase